jgi:acyl dehydratase
MNEIWIKPAVDRDDYIRMAGSEVGVSSWHLIDQKRIDAFAHITEDHQFIHVDPERAARETPYGTTVAHGFLTVSMLSVFSYEALPKIAGAKRGVNYGFDRLRFISPVKAGVRLRGRFTLVGAKLRGADVLETHTSVSVEIEGGVKPALVADWIGLIYFT